MTDNLHLVNQLLAASVHEIKNRFGLMFMQLDELLAEVPLNEALTHKSELIKSEALYIGNELVRILVSYKTLEGQSIVNQNQQYLVDFLEEKIARHSNTIHAHRLSLTFDCDEDLDAFFDSSIVSIILDTAIYNAIKAGAKAILLYAEQPDNFLHIQIHDDGPGFPPHMLSSDVSASAINTDQSTTGLGLFFASQLVQQHTEGSKHGRLELAQSQRLGGACVSLYLPQ